MSKHTMIDLYKAHIANPTLSDWKDDEKLDKALATLDTSNDKADEELQAIILEAWKKNQSTFAYVGVLCIERTDIFTDPDVNFIHCRPVVYTYMKRLRKAESMHDMIPTLASIGRLMDNTPQHLFDFVCETIRSVMFNNLPKDHKGLEILDVFVPDTNTTAH
jgi:hypothetical protein